MNNWRLRRRAATFGTLFGNSLRDAIAENCKYTESISMKQNKDVRILFRTRITINNRRGLDLFGRSSTTRASTSTKHIRTVKLNPLVKITTTNIGIVKQTIDRGYRDSHSSESKESGCKTQRRTCTYKSQNIRTR